MAKDKNSDSSASWSNRRRVLTSHGGKRGANRVVTASSGRVVDVDSC